MAKLITEQQKSRSISIGNGGGKSTRSYTMQDYTEAEDAYQALKNYAPAIIYIKGYQLFRDTIDVNPEFSDPGRTLYRGTVEYLSPTMGGQPSGGGGGGGGGGDEEPDNRPTKAKQDPEEEGVEPEDPSKVYFTFGTRQRTILQAFEQYRWKSSTLFALPDKKMLDINKDADDIAPEGVQVQDGAMFMHVVVVVAQKVLTPDFYKDVNGKIMAVNSKPFAYFDAYQVQFQGCDIEAMTSGDFKVEFHFEIRTPSHAKTFATDTKGTKVTVGSAVVPFDGFNYTWLSYQNIKKKEQNPDEPEKIEYERSVDSINVAQVYPLSRFNIGCLRYCKPPKNAKAKWKRG